KKLKRRMSSGTLPGNCLPNGPHFPAKIAVLCLRRKVGSNVSLGRCQSASLFRLRNNFMDVPLLWLLSKLGKNWRPFFIKGIKALFGFICFNKELKADM